MAAVGEHGELDARGPPVAEQRLDGGADGAAGVEDVVDDDDGALVDREVDVRGVDDGLLRAAGQVVAVKGDVEVAERHVGVEQVGDEAPEPRGEDRPATMDPDDREPVGLSVLLDDLVRDAYERATDVVAVEDDLLRWVHTVLPGLTGPG